ncbi:MAG TPA: hypothetical protein VED17_03980 [Nitrososphaerales archaeon]|nr:hypothetical protein [Nitrososphaerales archaeon]
MPRKKFNREEADKLWKNYTSDLVNSITETEKEGLEKGYSSFEIEVLWQTRVKTRVEKDLPKKKETLEK